MDPLWAVAVHSGVHCGLPARAAARGAVSVGGPRTPGVRARIERAAAELELLVPRALHLAHVGHLLELELAAQHDPPAARRHTGHDERHRHLLEHSHRRGLLRGRLVRPSNNCYCFGIAAYLLSIILIDHQKLRLIAS